MKRAFTLLIVLSLSLQMVGAEALSFYLAVEKMDVYAENALMRQIDSAAVQEAVAIQNDLKQSRGVMKRYNIKQSNDYQLKFDILQNTTLEKTEIGNQLKNYGYRVAENANFLGARKLYLGALSAKLNCELEQLKFEHHKRRFAQDEVRYQSGTISELDYLLAQQIFLLQEQALAKAEVERDKMYEKLKTMLNCDVEVLPEQPRTTPLLDLEHYMAATKYRFDVVGPQLKIKMVDLELPYYDEPKYLRRDDILEDYEALLRDRRQFVLELDQNGFAVKKEIEDAYIDIKQTMLDLETLAKKRTDVKLRWQQLQALYDQGMIAEDKLDEISEAYKEIDNGYQLTVVSLNNKRIALAMATSVGPAYE